jgi:hypothetical protein
MQTSRADVCAAFTHCFRDAQRMGRTAPKGRPTSAQGNALGITERSQSQALKGRPSRSPLQGSTPSSAGPAFRPANLNGGRLFQRRGLAARQQDNPNPCPRLKPNNLRTFPDPRRPTRAGGTKSGGPTKQVRATLMIRRFWVWIGSPDFSLVIGPQNCALRQAACRGQRRWPWAERRSALRSA